MKTIITLLMFIVAYASYGQETKKEYSVFIKKIIAKRDSLRIKYQQSDVATRKLIINDAREYLIDVMTAELFPYWYGTRWDYNGTTRTPKQGRIACGYFITNTLTDVGFNIPRIKWAQSASEVFIKKLSYNKVKRFRDKPITTIKKHLIGSGSGLYLVGLDNHTGFIYVNDQEVSFIHADYYEPEKGVVSEKIGSNSPLTDSSYRVIGKLMSDEMVVSWVLNRRIN